MGDIVMKRLFTLFAMGFAVMSWTTYTAPAVAAGLPNILIMGEDVDPDSVPRNSRVFKRVLSALSNQLHDEGFNVYDETAVSLDDFVQGRVRRTDAEIIDIAKSIHRPPIDVSIIFTIFASSHMRSYTTKIHARVEGRLLNVRTGQRLGNFEVELPRPLNAPHDCNRECIIKTVGKQSRILAQDLGAILTEKLIAMVGDRDGRDFARTDISLPGAYNLVFNGFNSEDIDEIEEFIVAFRGYKDHRPVRSMSRYHTYWYESDIKAARLNRNLRKMLNHLGVRGRVAFSGSTFNVDKITLRSRR